jgi:hypothetical protein
MKILYQILKINQHKNIPEEYKKCDKFHKVETDNSIWLYGDCRNPAAYIYFLDKKNHTYGGFEGFGGATLKFNLVNGEQISLKAPWHSNSHALYKQTGIDLRKKNYIWGIIALGVIETYPDYIYKNVIYCQGKIGSYSRIMNGAKKLAAQYKQDMYYYFESAGGSSSSVIKGS